LPLGITEVNRAAGFLDSGDNFLRDAAQQIRLRVCSVGWTGSRSQSLWLHTWMIC
jgi:hypothetical protein